MGIESILYCMQALGSKGRLKPGNIYERNFTKQIADL
jgi:hypothetical protein